MSEDQMSQTVATAPSSGVLAPRGQASRQQTTAALLSKVRQTYLDPEREFGAMSDDFYARRSVNGSASNFLMPPFIRVFAPRTEDERERAIKYLDEASTVQPELSWARAVMAKMQTALDVGFQSSQARVIVALMIDAYPNARPHSPDAYVASIMDVLSSEMIPNAAIAAACHELKTKSTFLPSLAEVLEMARAKARSLRLRESLLVKYLNWSDRCSDATQWLREVPLAEGDERVPFERNDPF